MITPAYAPTATERVLPRLALDFTTAALDARVTVTRALNTATVVNSSGYITGVNANLPRFDYDPVTLFCRGLLIEESRENAYSYSSDYTQSYWVKGGTDIGTSPVQLAPDGVSYMQKLQETNTTGLHRINPSPFPSVTSGTQYTMSVFAKKGERDILDVFESSYTGVVVARFNLTNGTAQSLNAIATAKIEPWPDGIYRCIVTATAQSTGTPGFMNFLQLYDGASSYTGTPGYGLYVWGRQFEAGAFATSYIPTTSTSLTRNADVVTMTGTNFSSWYTSSSAALAAVVIPITATGTRPIWQLDDTTANEIIALRGNVADPELYIVDGGVPQAQLDAGTITANTQYGLCAAFAANSCAVSQNGAAPVTTATATIPTVTQARIGSDGSNFLNGAVRTLRYWPQRVLNAETQAFSK